MAFSLRNFYSKHLVLSHIIIIVCTGFLVLWGAMFFLDYWTMHGQTSTVPDVRFASYEQARTILERSDLGIEIADSIYDQAYPPGTVVESMPRTGAVVKRGRQIYVTVTAFAPKQVTVTMPLVNSVSGRQAMTYLRGLGITDIRTVYVPAEFPDLVVGARYGDTPIGVGTVMPVNATVTLEVGTAPIVEPDIEIVENGAEAPTPEVSADEYSTADDY